MDWIYRLEFQEIERLKVNYTYTFFNINNIIKKPFLFMSFVILYFPHRSSVSFYSALLRIVVFFNANAFVLSCKHMIFYRAKNSLILKVSYVLFSFSFDTFF